MSELSRRLDLIPCGFFSLDRDWKITNINTTLLEILGYQAGELEGRPIGTLLPPASRVFMDMFFFPMVEMHNRADEIYVSFISRERIEIPMLLNGVRREGEEEGQTECIVMPMLKRVSYENEIMLAKRAADQATLEKAKLVAELQEALVNLEQSRKELLVLNEKLNGLATTDELTGLFNRRIFNDFIEYHVPLAKRIDSPLSLLMIDLDHFKTINDRFGHLAGDVCLKAVGDLLKTNFREIDLPARYGGEEFVVVLPNTDKAGALTIAERLRSEIAALPCNGFSITVSIGVSTMTAEIISPNLLIAAADRSLYRAKQNGRNCVFHFDDIYAP